MTLGSDTASGDVYAVTGATLVAGSLALETGAVSIDDTSSVEVDSAGGAGLGASTVNTGQVVSIEEPSLDATLVNNGVVRVNSGNYVYGDDDSSARRLPEPAFCSSMPPARAAQWPSMAPSL